MTKATIPEIIKKIEERTAIDHYAALSPEWASALITSWREQRKALVLARTLLADRGFRDETLAFIDDALKEERK
jgi:hypothetical protein